jgi:hypothetical protein
MVFTAAILKNAVFWQVMPCGSGKNRRFGGTYRSTLFIMMMDPIRSSETSVLTRAIRRHIAEDGILYSKQIYRLKFQNRNYTYLCHDILYKQHQQWKR